MSTLFLKSQDVKYIELSSNPEQFNRFAKLKWLEDSYELIPPQGKAATSFCLDSFTEKFGKAKTIKEIIPFPSYDDIRENISKPDVCFLDCRQPPEDFKDILTVMELPLLHENLTTQEIRYEVSLRDSLRQKLQLEVIETNKSFKDLAGATKMKTYFKNSIRAFDMGIAEKITVFLLGVPGAGKTFLAECIAGEFKYTLVKLDLSLLMNMSNPIDRLHYFFRYVEKLAAQGQYIVALLDEIAQMLSGGSSLQNQFKGQLLTVLEDLNTSRGYNIGKSIFIATENNIREIMDNTPQFMARWIENFFIHFPVEHEAKEMITMYLSIFDVDKPIKLGNKELTANTDEYTEHIYKVIETMYHNKKVEKDLFANRFIYAPREIKKFCQKLKINSMDSEIITEEILEDTAKLTPAQQAMLAIGITKMLNDAGKGFITI